VSLIRPTPPGLFAFAASYVASSLTPSRPHSFMTAWNVPFEIAHLSLCLVASGPLAFRLFFVLSLNPFSPTLLGKCIVGAHLVSALSSPPGGLDLLSTFRPSQTPEQIHTNSHLLFSWRAPYVLVQSPRATSLIAAGFFRLLDWAFAVISFSRHGSRALIFTFSLRTPR